jgi:hypothetical protein
MKAASPKRSSATKASAKRCTVQNRAVASGIKMVLSITNLFYSPNGDSLSRSLLLAVL